MPQITTTNELLIKLDNLQQEMDRRFDDLGGKLVGLDRDLKGEYVTQKEFETRMKPIERFYIGIVATVGLAFLGLLLAQVGWSK